MINAFYSQPFPVLALNGEYCLREQNLNDTDAFLEYYADPEVNRHILANFPRNRIEASAEINYCRSLFPQKRGIYWAIARRSDDKMIGAVGLYINNQHYRGEICYDLARPFWQCGIMSNALKTVIDFCFNTIGLARIEASTLKVNTASIALLKKFHFEHEGTLKKYRYYENAFHDIEMYALTTDSAEQIAALKFDKFISS